MADMASVADIFASMEYGPVLESSSLAETWLDEKSGKLASYINGEFTEIRSDGLSVSYKNSSLATFVSDPLQADIDHAVESSCTALKLWKGLTPYSRARHIYNIARHLQQHASVLAQMEALVRGVQARDPREWDVPGMIRTFYHHAGWAHMLDSEFNGYKARGVVVGITSYTTPLQALSWLVAPALASGCTVILKPSRRAAPVALLLAELCTKAGLPAGVLNVITGTSEAARQLATNEHVQKVTFFGSTQRGRLIREETSEHQKNVILLMSSRTPMIVLESADMDCACDAVIESAWFNQGQVPWAVTDVLVQQSIFGTFSEKMKLHMQKLRVGGAFDKMADVGSPCNPDTVEAVQNLIAKKKKEGSEVLTISESNPPSSGQYIIPAVVVGGTDPDSNVVLDDIWPLPVVMLNPFRTAKEAVSLANNSRYSLAAAVWAQDFSLAEEISQQLKVRTVWINCVNKFDPAVPFGASRQSGFGRIGGKEGMFEYLVPELLSDEIALAATEASSKKEEAQNGSDPFPKIDRTYKLYYGGGHKRADGNMSFTVNDHQSKPYAMVPDGSRKDIRNAVEAAQKALPGWKNCGPHLRAQILFYFAENIELRQKEFSEELARIRGGSEKEAIEEIRRCVECLFYWAGASDKNPISSSNPPSLQESKVNVCVRHEPLGVIGMVCPTSPFPLLAAVSILAPAIALGNAVVMVPCCPLPALWLCQVADTSDVPAGVINIITGSLHLRKTLAEHHDVNALWAEETLDLQTWETYTISNMKPVWIWKGYSSCIWKSPCNLYHTMFYLNSTMSKAVWKPIGGMFGN